jgi:hypothetical protein
VKAAVDLTDMVDAAEVEKDADGGRRWPATIWARPRVLREEEAEVAGFVVEGDFAPAGFSLE